MKQLKKTLLTLVALLAVTTQAWADDYFYIVISGTSGTLKYGSEFTSDNPYLNINEGDWYVGDPEEPEEWENVGGLTAVTIDASCNNYNGTKLFSLFSGFSGLTTINGLENLNTANVQDMGYMFMGCSSLTSLDLSSLNTASVTTLFSMFEGCSKLTSLDLSSWNTASVESLGSMFTECSSLTTVDLSSWNTAKVWNTSYMFDKCSKLENIYVGDGWSTAKVTRDDDMFKGCTKLLSMNTANPATGKTNAHTGDGGYLKVRPAAASPVTINWDATAKTGTFKMPAGNVTVEAEYYPQAALTAAPTAINDVLATTDGAIVNAGTVANIGETTTAQGQLMYYVSQTALDDAALLALAADQWTADVPTAAHLAEGTAYVYYYIRGNDSDTDEENFSDGDILAANALTVTIAAPPVAVTGVTLPSTATVTLGDAVALTAAVAPADATDKKVKWTVTAGTDKVKLYKDADCKTEVGTEATDVLTVYAKGLAVGDATVKVESNADATKTATCAVTAKHGTYAVAMKAGVTDGDQWTAKAGQDGQYQAMPLKGVEGGTKPVELKYAGDREVKRVTMRVLPTWKGDLSKISATELESDGVTVLVKNGMTLTGTLSENYKITIADGATVTLDGVTINGTNDENYKWAGISCAGTATIVLKDGSVNAVTGFHSDYPGIYVPEGSTLTIDGPGALTASSNGKGAGIGGGKNLGCGNIVIAATVGMVKAMKGADAPYSIGAGDESTCGTVTIGGTVYYDGSDYQNDGATYLAQAEIEYPTPVAFAANEYNEASWNGSKVVFTKKTAASTPTAVANSNTAVTWSDGWYTVAGEVTISGKVTLTADTYLILQDGAKLTINGQLEFRNSQKNLYIYGQRKGDGKLNVIYSSGIAMNGKIGKTVEIHGGEITAEGELEGLSAGYIKVFSGKITAICGSNGSWGIVFGNSCDVYGGEIEATTNNSSSVARGITDGGNGGTFTVYGGKVKATGSGVQEYPEYGSGFSGKVKSGTAGIKFYFSDNGTDWDEGTYYETATAAPSKKYAKAE